MWKLFRIKQEVGEILEDRRDKMMGLARLAFPNLEIKVLYHCKEEIHSEIELTIYKLKWYSPTNIINLMQLVIRLTTDRDLSILTVFKKHVFNSSEILEVTWYKPLYISPSQKNFLLCP